MNGEFDQIWKGPAVAYLGICLEGLRRTMEALVKIASIFPYTILDHYRYVNQAGYSTS
jgi:hypothetical protein